MTRFSRSSLELKEFAVLLLLPLKSSRFLRCPLFGDDMEVIAFFASCPFADPYLCCVCVCVCVLGEMYVGKVGACRRGVGRIERTK